MKNITQKDLEYVAIGSAILGSGGGGNPSTELLSAQYHLENYGPARVIDITELKDDDLVVPVGFMGAPSVGIEKLSSGDEFEFIFDAIEKTIGKRPTVLMPGEIGGSNAFIPFTLASKYNLPILDADSIGRAFPQLQMSSFNLYGISISPAFLADSQGNTVIIHTRNNDDNATMMEIIARHVTIAFGSNAAFAFYLLTGKQAKSAVVAGSISMALLMGKIVTEAQEKQENPVKQLCAAFNGRILIDGIIEDIDQKIENGFLQGTVLIQDKDGQAMKVIYHNENIVAYRNDQAVATTPDIIILLDAQTGHAITTESLQYGLRVNLIVLPSPALWTTEKGLRLVGPRAFGFDLDYIPASHF
jgi:hypothetical protein